MTTLSRRSFILSSALAVGGVITGVYLYKFNVAYPEKRARALHSVIETLAGLPGAVRFGNIFREQQQKNKKSMASAKSISRRLDNIFGDFRRNTIGEALNQQIQKELRSSRIQLVDGWYLARTEADLFALASMVKKAKP